MPIFEVTSPDGRVIEVTAPEGATEEQAIKYAQDNWANLSTPQKAVPPERDMTEEALRKVALTGKAAYKGLSSIPALAGEALAMPYNMIARGANYLGANLPESHPARALNTVGEALYPVQPETSTERISEDVIAATAGAGGMTKVGQILSGSKGATGMVGNLLASQPAMQVAGGATSGLAAGSTRELGGSEEQQMLAGLAGAFAPAAAIAAKDVISTTGRAAGRSISVLGKAGKKAEADDLIRQLAKNEPEQIRTAIDQRRTYIQGQPPTVEDALAQYKTDTGQTVGTALVKLQSVLKGLPETSSKLQTIDNNRLKSYGNVIGKMAGSESKMNALVKARESATSKLYKSAENLITPVDDDIRNLISRVPADAMSEAKKIAKLNGVTISHIDEVGLPADVTGVNGQSMIYMLKGLKELAYNPNTSSGVAKAARDLTDEFTTILEKTNPAYKMANSKWKAYSAPINRMEVGRILSDKLKNASDADTPMTFLNAADDAAKTIKDATGFARYKSFKDVMTVDEVKAIENVSKDMSRMLEASRISGKSTLHGAGKLGEDAQLDIPSLLSRPVAFAKWTLSKIGKDVSPEINRILADTLADPEKLAIVLKNTPKEQIPALMKFTNNLKTGAVSSLAPSQQIRGYQQ